MFKNGINKKNVIKHPVKFCWMDETGNNNCAIRVTETVSNPAIKKAE